MMAGTSTERPRPLYLQGRWFSEGESIDVINPATEEPFARVVTVGRGVVRKALEDAQAAWPGWRKWSGRDRGARLRRIADLLASRADELARTITLENGKPLAQSRGEVAVAVDHLHWFAEEARRGYGRVVGPQAEGKRHLIFKQPVGVVGAIPAWNFPLVLALRKVAPALAAGCPVVLKPASATPLSAVLLAEAVHEVDLPPGVFQLVAGNSSEIGAEMFENAVCRKVTFTGSTEVGRKLMRLAADSIMKLSLELGGHAPLIVFEDADFDRAVEGAISAKFRNTGQSCIAASRIYVQRPIFDRFVAAFVERTRSLKVGDGLDDGVEIGPLIDAAALDHTMAHIDQARAAGAEVLCGGGRAGLDKGFFLEPTVLVDVPSDALCMREETFGPVAPVAPFDDEAEVIRRANDTRYGLAAYVFTRDLARTWRVAEALEAGTVGVNDSVPATSQCPFGGMKQSGLGRELGSEGMEAYLETKHVVFGGID